MERNPNDFLQLLSTLNVTRLHWMLDTDNKILKLKGQAADIIEALSDLTRDINSHPDISNHESIFLQFTGSSLQIVFVHSTIRGNAIGGVRKRDYKTMRDAFADGLKLSKAMTMKCALAGLWHGGGKGILVSNVVVDVPDRQKEFQDFGTFVSDLHGSYVTAPDVGVNVADMVQVFSRTRFVTCIPEALGGGGSPAIPTARGVLMGLQAAFDYINPGDSVKCKTIAVQGVGNVGAALIEFLFEAGAAKVIACGVDPTKADKIRVRFQAFNFEYHVVNRDDEVNILCCEVDAVCPCAVGGALTANVISQLKTRIICGAANNQLSNESQCSQMLHNRGIIYVPDFLVNRMGLVACADEHAGKVVPSVQDPLIAKHLGKEWKNGIFPLTQRVLKESHDANVTTVSVAAKLSDKERQVKHPLYGHRGMDIIRSLNFSN